MNRSQFKSAARQFFRRNVRGGKVEFVWTFVGRSKGAAKERIVNGYFVHTVKGESSLWLAEWSEKWGWSIKECSNLHWAVLAKTGQAGIKGGSGAVPAPANYGVKVAGY